MTVRQDITRLAKSAWWLVLLRGLILGIFGIAVLVWPGLSLVVLIYLFAIFAIADGIGLIAHSFRTDAGRWPPLIMGVLTIVAGLVAIFWPGLTAFALLFVIAAWAVVSGLGEILLGFQHRKMPGSGWGWLVVSGAVSLVLGIVLAVAPVAGVFTLVWVLGIMLIVSGISLIVSAIMIRLMITRA